MEVQYSDPSSRLVLGAKPSPLCKPRCSSFPLPGGSQALAEGAGSPCVLQGTPPDLECPVCFNHYGLHRRPKVLLCRHVFCAVCLKLILRTHGGGWRIVCPLCQESSPVFGGLICHLPNKEEVLGSPMHPDPQTGSSFSLDAPAEKQAPGGQFHLAQDGGHGVNRVAAKRLVFLLLLLLVLLAAIVLPFLQPGLLKWALCGAVACGLAVVGILCFNPRWKGSSSGLAPPVP